MKKPVRLHRSPRLLALGLVVLMQASPTLALSRVGAAAVELQNGQACFRIKDDSWLFKNHYKVFGISVVDRAEAKKNSVDPYTENWGFNFSPRSESVKADARDCFAYGALPAGGVHRVSPKGLAPATLYSVTIDAEELGGSTSTYGYRALFCLMASSDGKPVLRVPKNEDEALTPGAPQSCVAP